MSDTSDKKNAVSGLAMSNALFGPPPVLSTENLAHYNEIWERLTTDFKPNDIAELMMIRNLVDANWELQRCIRQRTLSVERRIRLSAAFQEKRVEEIKKRRDREIERLAQKMGMPPNEFLQVCQLDSELKDFVGDTDEILKRIPQELEHARDLESAITYHLQLEVLINGATKRRDSALALLELYRAGLGQRLREESDKIIDVTATVVEEPSPQIEAPSIVFDDGNDNP
jgi:hypothetical protein